MFLDAFYSVDGDRVRITREQASRFAKEIAGDFNPIHDPDAWRFCVPGDLLWALVLRRYGLAERMAFCFRGMVGDAVVLQLPTQLGESFALAKGRQLIDERGEHLLRDVGG